MINVVRSPEDLKEYSKIFAVTKPGKVTAWKLEARTELKVMGLTIMGYPGEYIIMNKNGVMSVCSESVFKEEYEIIP